jgi:phage-related protein
MDAPQLKRIVFRFFEADSGAKPVRMWLLSLSVADRKTVGEGLQTVEYGWPIGMPVCRSLTGHKGLWEARASISDGQIARVFFCIKNGEMIGLHGFVKKTQKTPPREIAIAVRRMKGLRP